jgi:hypothetical protein
LPTIYHGLIDSYVQCFTLFKKEKNMKTDDVGNTKKRDLIYHYKILPTTVKGKWLFYGILSCYLFTWLPHFGILNSMIWIGPFTLPIVWIYAMNILNTIGVFLIYKFYFKSFADRMEKEEVIS